VKHKFPSFYTRAVQKLLVLSLVFPLLVNANDLLSCDNTNAVESFENRLVSLNPATRPQPKQPINRIAVFSYLDVEGRKYIDSGETLCDWKDKLGFKKCDLKLPFPRLRTLSIERIERREEQAVVVVGTYYLCSKCSHLHMMTATGFFINSDGALVTCRHVLANIMENGRGVVVMTRDGHVYPVEAVLASEPLNDVLVLKVKGKGFPALSLAKGAAIGESVYVMGHPAEYFYMFTTGIVNQRYDQIRDGGLCRFIVVSADFAKGASGGPVCNKHGAVVGIVNNTESILWNSQGGQQNNLQMVIKNCTAVEALKSIITQ